ncbi:MAG: Rieske 2Fe-2S domain-containing protein [Pseudohongiella sp.]|nr:Rieske 2Fe-2S domain-containing protein [Pseudohongiella sp.]
MVDSSSKSKAKPLSRRTIFKMGLATGIAVPMSAFGQPPARMRPQPGDQLVFEEGPHQDQLVRADLLELEQKPVSAMARDPQTKVLRDGSRLNRVMITRIDTEKMTARYQGNAAEGVIAYSAVCTHTGCDVINWDAGELNMACPCHESQFDIYDGGKVVGGPAPRPLAMLPLEVVDGVITVAAEFRGRVGFTQQF